MRALQFLILIATAHVDRAVFANAVRTATQRHALRTAWNAGGVVVLVGPSTPVTEIGPGRGVVLGTIFNRTVGQAGRYGRVKALPPECVRFETLTQDYWGSYTAVIAESTGSAAGVVRDPSGGFGCFVTHAKGLVVIFSDATLAHSLGLVTSDLDPGPIIHALTFPAWPLERTGLSGVSEIQPGTALQFDANGGEKRSLAWNPWRFASRNPLITDPAAAATAVREETQRCVSSWASEADSILLELSGGLDSSVMAACLKGRRDGLALVNLATPDPGADERLYAGQVADSLGLPLKTVLLRLEDATLELSQPLAPRPNAGLLHQTIDAALQREAAQVGVDAFFSGGGGDNVFCYLSTAAPATDALLSRGPGQSFVRAVADLATLHGCSAWEAGRLALRKSWRGPRRWRRNIEFLNPESAPYSPDPHPWHEFAPMALPGRREHIDLLLGVQSALIGHQRETLAPMRFPLLSQPLVELCLQIQTWLWIDGGRNRAVARDAFANMLPPGILQRRTKGDFMGLLGALYMHHRLGLIDLLLGGWLAEQRVVDRTAIEAFLKLAEPTTDLRFFRVLELATVELWARSWRASRGGGD